MGIQESYESNYRSYFYDATRDDYQIHTTVYDDWGNKRVNVLHYGPVPPPGFPKDGSVGYVPGYLRTTTNPTTSTITTTIRPNPLATSNTYAVPANVPLYTKTQVLNKSSLGTSNFQTEDTTNDEAIARRLQAELDAEDRLHTLKSASSSSSSAHHVPQFQNFGSSALYQSPIYLPPVTKTTTILGPQPIYQPPTILQPSVDALSPTYKPAPPLQTNNSFAGPNPFLPPGQPAYQPPPFYGIPPPVSESPQLFPQPPQFTYISPSQFAPKVTSPFTPVKNSAPAPSVFTPVQLPTPSTSSPLNPTETEREEFFEEKQKKLEEERLVQLRQAQAFAQVQAEAQAQIQAHALLQEREAKKREEEERMRMMVPLTPEKPVKVFAPQIDDEQDLIPKRIPTVSNQPTTTPTPSTPDRETTVERRFNPLAFNAPTVKTFAAHEDL